MSTHVVARSAVFRRDCPAATCCPLLPALTGSRHRLGLGVRPGLASESTCCPVSGSVSGHVSFRQISLAAGDPTDCLHCPEKQQLSSPARYNHSSSFDLLKDTRAGDV